MFDDKFTIDDVRQAVVELEIVGTDNYRLEGRSTMAEISRDPLDLVKQTVSEHQYPDGFALFLGTLFAPTQDRDVKGSGFTHKEGDVVRISTPKLGVLENRVTTSKAAPPWNFGISDLMKNLAKFLSRRGLLGRWLRRSTCDLYPHGGSGMQFRGRPKVGSGLECAAQPLKYHQPVFPQFQENLMTETLTHFIGGKQISAPARSRASIPPTPPRSSPSSRTAAPKT